MTLDATALAALRALAAEVGKLPAAGHPQLLGPLMDAKEALRRIDLCAARHRNPEPPLPDAQLANGGACS